MSHKRAWSFGEELAHSITHGIGLLAGVVGFAVLVILAARKGDPWRLVACSIYAFTLVLLYAASTLYHALSATKARRVFQVLDHAAIFLLIAGTYTPFALVNLRGPWGWTLFGIVWTLAAAGVAAKAVFGTRWPIVSTAVYLCMGWTVVIAVKPLLAHVPPGGPRVARRRRPRVHRRRGVLRVDAPAVQPRHLARLRPCRQRLSLHRRRPVRGLTRAGFVMRARSTTTGLVTPSPGSVRRSPRRPSGRS